MLIGNILGYIEIHFFILKKNNTSFFFKIMTIVAIAAGKKIDIKLFE